MVLRSQRSQQVIVDNDYCCYCNSLEQRDFLCPVSLDELTNYPLTLSRVKLYVIHNTTVLLGLGKISYTLRK